jgi:hypothetical protein
MIGFRFGRLLAVILATMVAAAPARADSAAYPPIVFVGQNYDFYRKDRITAGWAFYFAPNRQDPDRSEQAIIVNYFDGMDDAGKTISAEGVARGMAAQGKAKGATLLPPFATPDPLIKGKYNFFISLYYVYPQDRNGDIWIGKVSQVGDQVVGMLYKQQVAGADSTAISDAVKNWLLQNLRTYGSALGALSPPAAH